MDAVINPTGFRIVRLVFDNAISVVFMKEGATEITLTLSTAFHLVSPSGSTVVDPDTMDNARDVLLLLHRNVAKFAADGSGRLHFSTDKGLGITARPHEAFEAWELTQCPMSVIAMPGGGISQWVTGC